MTPEGLQVVSNNQGEGVQMRSMELQMQHCRVFRALLIPFAVSTNPFGSTEYTFHFSSTACRWNPPNCWVKVCTQKHSTVATVELLPAQGNILFLNSLQMELLGCYLHRAILLFLNILQMNCWVVTCTGQYSFFSTSCR